MLGPYLLTTESRWRAAYGDPCGVIATAGRIVLDGRTFQMREAGVPAFEAFERIRARYNYKLTGTDTGFYNCRHIRFDPTAPMSVHSWGMALDINWLENPAGNKLVTDIPMGMILEVLALRTNSGARVFRWGGDWDWDGDSLDHSYIDAMHFEVVAHPLDLATGIKEGEDMFTDKEVHELKAFVAEVLDEASSMKFAEYVIKDIRKDIITRDELNAAIAAALGGLKPTDLTGKRLVLRVEAIS